MLDMSAKQASSRMLAAVAGSGLDRVYSLFFCQMAVQVVRQYTCWPKSILFCNVFLDLFAARRTVIL